MLVQQVLAAIGLVVCVVLLVRQALNEAGRRRMDAAGARALAALRHLRGSVGHRWRRGRVRQDAAREARSAIERARRAPPPVERQGNVIRPKSFEGGRGPDDTLH